MRGNTQKLLKIFEGIMPYIEMNFSIFFFYQENICSFSPYIHIYRIFSEKIIHIFVYSGKPSRSREIYNGDIIQFGSFVTEIRPVIARVTVAVVPGNSGQNRFCSKTISYFII